MLRSLLIALLFPSLLSAQGIDEAARARAAVNRGEILRLSKVLPRIQDQFGGVVLDTFLVRRGSAYAYEFSILTQDSRLIDVMVDAATGKVMEAAAERRTGGSDRVRPGGRRGDGDRPDDDRDDNDDDSGDGGGDGHGRDDDSDNDDGGNDEGGGEGGADGDDDGGDDDGGED